jgi:hypothetical protein
MGSSGGFFGKFSGQTADNIKNNTLSCQTICYKCCAGLKGNYNNCGNTGGFDTEIDGCKCTDNKPSEAGC